MSGPARRRLLSLSDLLRRMRGGRSADGTMSTVGDVGYVDDGFLCLTDRATFMIISGGVNIYP